MSEPLELGVERDGARLRLLAPGVGWFTCALARGRVVGAGEHAGVLVTLGRAATLVVPAEAAGRIVSDAPERVHAPVGFGDVLYELEAEVAGARGATRDAARKAPDGGPLVVRSAQSGRFYHRAAPGEASFVAQGKVVEDGQPIGLIEVMKTFTHVVYRAGGGLPQRARVVRMVAGDGADVRAGDALIELAPE